MLRKFGILTLAAGLLAICPGLARADKLDKTLNETMPDIVKHVQGKGYKNVGVLRFSAQKGNRPESYSIGPINGNMAARVENLLVVHGGDDKGPLFGVIHDAGLVAQDQKVGSWSSNPTERAKLFTVDYPLAWGDKKVKADAFLTGKVALSVDLKKATVTLVAFTRTTLKPVQVAEFTVDTDASLVRDLGFNFALTQKQKTSLVRSRNGEALTELVLDQASQQQQQNRQPQNKEPVQPKQPDKEPTQPKQPATAPAQPKQPDKEPTQPKQPDKEPVQPKQPDKEPAQPKQPTQPKQPGQTQPTPPQPGQPQPTQPKQPGQPQPKQPGHTQPTPPQPGQPQPTQPKQPGQAQLMATPDNIAGIELKIKSGTEPVEVRSESAGDVKYQIECPAKGKPIVMSLTNKTEKRIGVVLRVAGMSTIFQEKDESVRCRKWVIPAGKTFEIKGFYQEKETKHLPFAVLDGDEAAKAIAELGDKALFIQVDVFEDAEGTQPDMTITRGLPRAKDRSARTNYPTLRSELLKQSGLKRTTVKGRSVIVPDTEAVPNPGLKEVDFPKNALQVGSLTVRVAPREAGPVQPTQPQPDQPDNSN